MATGAGELEDLMQDTVKFIGGVADKIWIAGSAAKDMILDGELKQDSKAKDWFGSDLKKKTKLFEDLDMLVSAAATKLATHNITTPLVIYILPPSPQSAPTTGEWPGP